MSTDSGVEPEKDVEVVLSAERLHLGIETRPRERVRVVRRIVQTMQSIEVPVRREEISIVREPLQDTDGWSLGVPPGDRRVDLVLRQEVASVTLHVEAYETVHVAVERIDDEEIVEASLRSEHVEITGDGPSPTAGGARR